MGWAGRNGKQAQAILYHKAIGNDVSEQAKLYGETLAFAAGNSFLRIFFSLTKRVILVDVIVAICVPYGVLVKIVVFGKLIDSYCKSHIKMYYRNHVKRFNNYNIDQYAS